MGERLRSVMHVEEPDNVEVSLTITMRLGDWKALAAQSSGHGWPSWELADTIRKSVEQLESKIHGEHGTAPPPLDADNARGG